ncbi:acyltransferase [uncultured Caulobacter sp.]|uniref:acyltransferase family protein n=1 Tax=uncultured Caulobacter sp. TaxID=158749 RepID=UPI00260950CB|nr:acyltransferase [uncultured Caulobacter sp.]
MAGLDLLRFLAATMVGCFHLSYWVGVKGSTTYGLTKGIFSGQPGFQSGWVGVEIFFVISGFVIAYSAENVGATSFARSRFLRLWPAAAICASLTLLVMLWAAGSRPSEVFTTYLRSVFFVPFPPWIDGVYWTLGVEIAFYGLVWLLLRLGRFGWIDGLACVLALTSTSLWLAAPMAPLIAKGLHHRFGELLLLTHGCEFACGILLWLVLFKRAEPRRLIFLALALLGGVLEILDEASVKIPGPPMNAFAAILLWLGAVALLTASVVHRSLVDRWLTGLAKLIRLMGLGTYPLYLVHNSIGAVIMGRLAAMGVEKGYCGPIALAVAMLIAGAVTLWLEPPVLRLLRTLMGDDRRIVRA